MNSLKCNKILLSIMLSVLGVISFLMLNLRILKEPTEMLIKALALTALGCYCVFEIVRIIDFERLTSSGNKIGLFCLIICMALFSMQGCSYHITKNPFSEFVFPISAIVFCVMSLLKMWAAPKALQSKGAPTANKKEKTDAGE